MIDYIQTDPSHLVEYPGGWSSKERCPKKGHGTVGYGTLGNSQQVYFFIRCSFTELYNREWLKNANQMAIMRKSGGG